MDDKRKTLEAFSKSVMEGLPFGEDHLILPDSDAYNNALLARNLSGEALAHQVLKNTGVPVPHPTDSRLKHEDFLNRIVKETHPSLDPNISLRDNSSQIKASGDYDPNTKSIRVASDNLDRKGILGTLATALHEKGHHYDDQMLGHVSEPLDQKVFRLAKAQGVDVRGMDPVQAYELLSKNHHANIKGFREGSFELGALKSLMNTGVFRALGPLSAVSQITPSIADLKEGNPNTAAARMLTGLAPAGSGGLDKQLMERANIEDMYPHLKDSTYLRTLKNIGERRMKMGKSPVVEGFSGEQVDTSATEPTDYENMLKQKMKQGSEA